MRNGTKLSGAREGEAETETKSWKCRSSEGAREEEEQFLLHTQEKNKTPKLRERHTIKTKKKRRDDERRWFCIRLGFEYVEEKY